MKKKKITDDRRQFVEDLSVESDFFGVPRMGGRILGWLSISDPPYQTCDQISEAVGGSKSSISTLTRLLLQRGLIEKVGVPHDRKIYFRIHKYWWAIVLKDRIEQTQHIKVIVMRALDTIGNQSVEVRQSLEQMGNYYECLDKELPALWQQWLDANALGPL